MRGGAPLAFDVGRTLAYDAVEVLAYYVVSFLAYYVESNLAYSANPRCRRPLPLAGDLQDGHIHHCRSPWVTTLLLLPTTTMMMIVIMPVIAMPAIGMAVTTRCGCRAPLHRRQHGVDRKGQRPIGWNAYWMRNSPRTLDILQSQGFKYHIDEPSMDEPFIVKLRGGDFVTVPYTFHMNDIVSFPFQGWNPAAYEAALRDEFDQLYEEGSKRRRMMVVSLYDRISGHANRVRVLDRFLTCATAKPDVWFARKDEIAAYALANHSITPFYDRGRPTDTGLPGSLA